MENMGAAFRGMYRDMLLNTSHQVTHDSGWISNTIVERGRSLLAAFMKSEPGACGISSMALGQGEETWDRLLTQPEQRATNLVAPFYHLDLKPEDIIYLNDHDEAIVTPGLPTRRLQIRATFGPHDPPDQVWKLREFGLFGKFGSQDFMINSVRHPLIQKVASDTLIRVVRLYF